MLFSGYLHGECRSMLLNGNSFYTASIVLLLCLMILCHPVTKVALAVTYNVPLEIFYTFAVYASCVWAEAASSTPFSTRKKWETVWMALLYLRYHWPQSVGQKEHLYSLVKWSQQCLAQSTVQQQTWWTVVHFYFSLFLTPSWKCTYIFWGTSLKIDEGC